MKIVKRDNVFFINDGKAANTDGDSTNMLGNHVFASKEEAQQAINQLKQQGK